MNQDSVCYEKKVDYLRAAIRNTALQAAPGVRNLLLRKTNDLERYISYSRTIIS